tara:strand:+ start:44 stop:394 length:351 start_codon:yes stop_codon:yes gene_type:complete
MHYLTQEEIVGVKKLLKVTNTPYIVKNLSIHNSLAVIAIKVCLVHGITLAELKSEKRNRHLLLARIDFYYIASNYTKKKDADIARYLNRHHTVVIHYAKHHKPSADYKNIYGLLDQ